MAEPINTRIERRQRWDKPFAESWNEEQIARTLALPIFNGMNADKFPAKLSLLGIIRNDARLVQYEPGDIVARENDYGSSAFVIVSGEVTVILPPGLPEQLLGRPLIQEPEGWWGAVKRIFNRSKHKESRHYATEGWDVKGELRKQHGVTRVHLKNIDEELADCQVTRLGPGELLGEVAALTRSPRTASLIVSKPSEILEIRWQGFRDLRKYDDGFRHRIDKVYRERNRISYLKALPFFSNLDEQILERISEQTLLESYGDLEWKSVPEDAHEEPGIVNQGDYVDGLLILLNGGARIVGGHHAGEQTMGFLRADDFFGMHEIVDRNSRQADGEYPVHHFSLKAVGHADLLRIPTQSIEQELLPNLSADQLSELRTFSRYPDIPMDPGFQEFIGKHQFANGRSTMVIDTSRCVRCDDCVSACARNHDNNPKFVRHGRQYSNLMIVNACMHCFDPVCMIGCPTGAISRRVSGEVVINDETCIGCKACAEACPYDNIRMVEISDPVGNPAVEQATHKPIIKATKCDLCVDNSGGPACERACPHDALSRVDLTDSHAMNALLERAINFQ